jgi:ribosomal protein S18 acetylase RimI-like enzyme
VIVREALPGELAEVGEIRVNAYRAGGFLAPDSAYTPVLRDLGAAGDGTVLVAADGSRILGTVMLQFWPNGGEIGVADDEAEIRALAVLPDAQGQGAGSALLQAAITRAAQRGVRHLVLLTQPDMLAAQRLYQRAGFRRLPERDWSPVPGHILLAYGLPLSSAVPG